MNREQQATYLANLVNSGERLPGEPDWLSVMSFGLAVLNLEQAFRQIETGMHHFREHYAAQWDYFSDETAARMTQLLGELHELLPPQIQPHGYKAIEPCTYGSDQ
ncbi:MAG: hypothetical protein KDA43_14780 [Hyphomonas sp.]|nr:hypothetical protein [Hyphomonas sp.]